MLALDSLASRYGARPSDILLDGIDRFGFDIAVAWTAVKYRKSPPSAETIQPPKFLQYEERDPDPIAYFKQMGQSGWNQSN